MHSNHTTKPSCCSASRGSIAKEGTVNQQATLKNTDCIKFKEKMVYLSGGEFLMGTEDRDGFSADNEGPISKVNVKPFYIDKTSVSNREFKQFIDETGYMTDAEKYGWSFVFYKFLSEEQQRKFQQPQGTPWWFAVEKAYWYQPVGEGSGVEDRMEHPVIHVSWNDAKAFCDWAGKRLPTEKEWEFAARGGLEQKKYVWGDELHPNGEHYCNIWQGDFPRTNTEEDGYLGTAPVESFPPNGYGLYNMAGNVWEWCSNWFDKSLNLSPKVDPQAPKAMRGGSYLCHYSYCNRYRVAARSSNTMDSSTGNLGFRCARDAK
ncbi:formylglycine-generating enzyme family protein [Virgibacillus halodenitrificans]|uniref:formylglycine-generating enzyme family protein n=1 Tax=Virgibacillus halodenitrificans TaxID=1482 RepID=UPI001F3D74B4|nr:formylglycine-generating enzyme family protein [Virgibacillus halodenitrificans]